MNDSIIVAPEYKILRIQCFTREAPHSKRDTGFLPSTLQQEKGRRAPYPSAAAKTVVKTAAKEEGGECDGGEGGFGR